MIIQADKFYLPADSVYGNDICGNCGHFYVEKPATFFSCPEKKCKCTCKHDSSADCLVHWRCACSANYLCNYHITRPDLVVLRYQGSKEKWKRNELKLLVVKARPLATRQKQSRLKAWTSRCGSCLALLPKSTKSAKPACPKGCECRCNNKKGIGCLVHFSCSCINGEYPCHFHREKRPDILRWVWAQLPEPDRSGFTRQLKAAGLEPGAQKVKDNTRAAPSRKESRSGSKHLKHARSFGKQFADYESWLSRQPLSEHSRRNYRSRIKILVDFLNAQKDEYLELTPITRDEIARDFKRHLKQEQKAKPATANSYLAGMNNFFGFLGIGASSVKAEVLVNEAPKSLTRAEQKKLIRAIEKTRRTKDRALMFVLLYTGIRISECQKLSLDDVIVVGRNARLIVRSGKGDKYREVQLNSKVCTVLQEWLAERKEKFGNRPGSFFVNAQGEQMSTQGIDKIVRKIGQECGLEISAHLLRHTLLTNLVRRKNDVVLVADIAGHSNLKTTQRYTLPSSADKAKALEELLDL